MKPPRASVRLVAPSLAWVAAACGAALWASGGHPALWLVVAGIAAILVSAPGAARRAIDATAVDAPRRIALQAGVARPVPLSLSGACRDALVRIALPGRIERARPRAVAWPGLGRASLEGVELRAAVRGRYPALAVELRSRFPFGLCEARRELLLDSTLVVRPRPLRETAWIERALSAERDGAALGGARDPLGEFFALTEWRRGEPLSRVRWRASRRRGRWLSDERRGRAREPLYVCLATRGAAAGAAFERAVSAAATLVDVASKRGRPLVLLELGDERRILGHERSAALDALASVRPSAPPSRRAASAPSQPLPSRAVVVAAADPLASEHELAPHVARGGITLVVVDATGEPAVLRPAQRGPARVARGRLAEGALR